ncbi:hypothetical protein THAOC_14498, partial [Thalassiosira oceanica]
SLERAASLRKTFDRPRKVSVVRIWTAMGRRTIAVLSTALSLSLSLAFHSVSRTCQQPPSTLLVDNDRFWPGRDIEVDGEAEDDSAHKAALDSVVKIFASHSEPDYLLPWQRQQQSTSTSSGFIVEVPGGIRVITNAHSVEYTSVVQVQLRGDDEKYAATVEAVSNEADLAILRVDLFDKGTLDLYPLPIGRIPSLQESVEVIGYPAGGDSLSITKGVVSRIEMQEYTQAGEILLALQIDAAINPGNSGGPVVNERLEVIGVAFQGLDEAENVGYVVPSSVLLHFMEDVRRGKNPRFCKLGCDVQFLESSSFRKLLKMKQGQTNEDPKKQKQTGVMVRRVYPLSAAVGKLKKLRLSRQLKCSESGIPVGNDGKIPFRRGERVALGGYVSSLFAGDIITLTILREGLELEVSFPVQPIQHLVPAHFDNEPPPYLICSGLVFTVLSVPYLDAKGAWDEFYSESVTYLQGLVNQPPSSAGDQVVVLAQVLAHRDNLGYEDLTDLRLLKFNGQSVRSLRHLNELITTSNGDFLIFEFAPEDGGRMIILERENNERATKEVCHEHSIGVAALAEIDTLQSHRPRKRKKAEARAGAECTTKGLCLLERAKVFTIPPLLVQTISLGYEVLPPPSIARHAGSRQAIHEVPTILRLNAFKGSAGNRYFGVISSSIWDPRETVALASPRRAERNTATSLARCKTHRLGKDGVGRGAADGSGAASDA